MPWVLLAIVVLWLTWSGDGDPVAGVEDLVNTIVRGARVTHASYDKTTGVVGIDPNALADQAGVTLEVMALARMLSSEEGNADNATKAAIAWACVNYARGKTVSELLLHAVDPNHSGYFGTFKNIDRSSPYFKADSNGNAIAADRYASTALDPYEGDVAIAQGVLDGSIPDLTQGAQQFDRPAGEKNPDAVAAKRMNAGAELVMPDGVDPGLRFWRT